MASQKEYEEKLKQLIQYIEQDGHEKAEEIDVMAEEEYFMEKRNYIEKRVGAVKKYYDNLESKFAQQMVLDISKVKGQSYRNILGARNLVIEDILNSVRQRFKNLDDPDNQCIQKKVLFDLTLQGLLQMMEPKVIVQIRKNDLPLMQKVLPQVQNVFNSMTKMNIAVSLEEKEYLPDKGTCGVVLYTKSNSISLNNTLDKKLEQMDSQLLPHIRKAVFGRNPNRKHSD